VGKKQDLTCVTVLVIIPSLPSFPSNTTLKTLRYLCQTWHFASTILFQLHDSAIRHNTMPSQKLSGKAEELAAFIDKFDV